MGVGTQIIYIDPENDLVIVARWIEKEKAPEFVRMVLASIKSNKPDRRPNNFLLYCLLTNKSLIVDLNCTKDRKTNYLWWPR